MENQHIYHPNKIQISPFGALFLKQLPQQPASLTKVSRNQKQNESIQNGKIRKRGEGINFHQFANHTQTMIHREVNCLFRVKTEPTQVNQAKRKQILHHNNWMNEQKLIKHKLSDAQIRMQQAKFSEYDWKKQAESFKKAKFDILHDWQTDYQSREKRMKSKIKTLLDKKYPKQSESGLIRLSLKKTLK